MLLLHSLNNILLSAHAFYCNVTFLLYIRIITTPTTLLRFCKFPQHFYYALHAVQQLIQKQLAPL